MKTIPLNHGRVTVVDDEDFELLSQHKWFAHRGNNRHTWYACRGVYFRDAQGIRRRQTQLMHRVILAAPDGVLVDHQDGDGLNNRRENIRLATDAQNSSNRHLPIGTSKFLGVCWNKKSSKWQASIKKHDRSTYLGMFEKEEDAARAYDAAATRIHGEFACLNFPSTKGVA